MRKFLTASHCCVLLTFALLCGSMSSRAAETFHKLAALPPNSNPGTVLQGLDGNLYGVLVETHLPQPHHFCGAIYKITPAGALTYLHRFPYIRESLTINFDGGVPNQLAMGKDGYLYGLTREGGAFGQGVYYRLRTTGEFQVLKDLEGPMFWQFAYSARNYFVDGPDNAFYLAHGEHDLMRLGYDGSIAQIYKRPAGEWGHANITKVKPDASEIHFYWIKGRPTFDDSPQTIHVRVISVPSGEVLQSREIEFFGGYEYLPYINGVFENEIIVSSHQQNWQTNLPGRIASINGEGVATTILEVPSAAAAELETEVRSLHTMRDGTIYFSAGMQRKGDLGLGGGSNIYRLERDGTIVKVADLDGYPLASWCEGLDGHFYGMSWGPAVLGPEDSEPPVEEAVGLSRLRAPISSAAQADPALGKPGKRGLFRYSPLGADQNVAPYAGADRFAIPARMRGGVLSLDVLRNDRDLEKQLLEITQVGEPKHGTTTIAPAEGNRRARIDYAPASTPRRSDRFSYVIRDNGGKTAIGQVCVRGDVKGIYAGSDLPGSEPDAITPVRIDLLHVRISPTGKFSGLLKVNGVNVPFGGRLDDDDQARIARKIKGTSEVVTLRLEVRNANGMKELAYGVRYLGQDFSGTLPVK